METSFTPLTSLLGGMIIGASASLLWLLRGRVAGISGITSGALLGASDRGWRVAFVAGLLASGVGAALLFPSTLASTTPREGALIVIAGLLVGFGTRMGSGCTSGHGICGLARGRGRSLVATLTFMLTGAATVWLWSGS